MRPQSEWNREHKPSPLNRGEGFLLAGEVLLNGQTMLLRSN